MQNSLRICAVVLLALSASALLGVQTQWHVYGAAIRIDQAYGGPGIVTLDPSSGPAGTFVTVSGALLAGDTGCSITSPSRGLITGYRCTILPGGLISGSFTVGVVIRGQYLVIVSGSPGNPAGDFDQGLFTVT